jgi:hypothetical protein
MTITDAVRVALCLGLLSSCSGEYPDGNPPDETPPTVVEKGDRLLGMDVLDSTPTVTFGTGVAKAKAAGVQFVTFPVLWSQINATGATYDPTWVQNIKDMAAFCRANGLKLSLTFWTVDVTGKHLPADLMTTRFDDPSHTMATRFVALLDRLFIAEGIDSTLLTSVQIGNELDAYDAAGDPDFSWSEYGAFLFQVKVLLASRSYSSLKTGFTGTLYGLREQKAIFSAIAAAVDVVGVTYYPQNTDFTVKDPSVASSEIAGFVGDYSAAGKPLYLQEVGYQSGAGCNSSEEKQAQFVRNIFAAWDTQREHIRAVSFLRLNDISPASADAIAQQYGMRGNTRFIEFIRSLGLVAYDGSEKQAFLALSESAHARGW